MTEPKLPAEPTPRTDPQCMAASFDKPGCASGRLQERITELERELTSALARVAEMEGEMARLKTVERDLSQMVNAKSNLLCNIGDTLRSRGINPTFHMDERVIELAHMMEAANARAEADAKRLEFMLEHSAFISVSPAREGLGELYQLWEQDEDENLIVISGDGKFFATERAAIDAAMVKS